jgi:hypothetical protein
VGLDLVEVSTRRREEPRKKEKWGWMKRDLWSDTRCDVQQIFFCVLGFIIHHSCERERNREEGMLDDFVGGRGEG